MTQILIKKFDGKILVQKRNEKGTATIFKGVLPDLAEARAKKEIERLTRLGLKVKINNQIGYINL